MEESKERSEIGSNLEIRWDVMEKEDFQAGLWVEAVLSSASPKGLAQDEEEMTGKVRQWTQLVQQHAAELAQQLEEHKERALVALPEAVGGIQSVRIQVRDLQREYERLRAVSTRTGDLAGERRTRELADLDRARSAMRRCRELLASVQRLFQLLGQLEAPAAPAGSLPDSLQTQADLLHSAEQLLRPLQSLPELQSASRRLESLHRTWLQAAKIPAREILSAMHGESRAPAELLRMSAMFERAGHAAEFAESYVDSRALRLADLWRNHAGSTPISLALRSFAADFASFVRAEKSVAAALFPAGGLDELGRVVPVYMERHGAEMEAVLLRSVPLRDASSFGALQRLSAVQAELETECHALLPLSAADLAVRAFRRPWKPLAHNGLKALERLLEAPLPSDAPLSDRLARLADSLRSPVESLRCAASFGDSSVDAGVALAVDARLATLLAENIPSSSSTTPTTTTSSSSLSTLPAVDSALFDWAPVGRRFAELEEEIRAARTVRLWTPLSLPRATTLLEKREASARTALVAALTAPCDAAVRDLQKRGKDALEAAAAEAAALDAAFVQPSPWAMQIGGHLLSLPTGISAHAHVDALIQHVAERLGKPVDRVDEHEFIDYWVALAVRHAVDAFHALLREFYLGLDSVQAVQDRAYLSTIVSALGVSDD